MQPQTPAQQPAARSRQQPSTTIMLSPAFASSPPQYHPDHPSAQHPPQHDEPPTAPPTTSQGSDMLAELLERCDQAAAAMRESVAVLLPSGGDAISLPAPRASGGASTMRATDAAQPAVAAPREVAVLEREVTRLLRYADIQRERHAEERRELEAHHRGEAERAERRLREESQDLIDAFQRRAEAAERRAEIAEVRAAEFAELPAALNRSEELLRQFEEAEQGWVALVREREAEADAKVAEVQKRLDESVQSVAAQAQKATAAEEATKAAEGRLAQVTQELDRVERGPPRSAAATQTSSADSADLNAHEGCLKCDEAAVIIAASRDKMERLTAVVTKLQDALQQQTNAAEQTSADVDRLRHELADERAAARAAQGSAEERLAAVRKEFEGATVPGLKAAHREEMELATQELEAAHKQITSLLRKNRALAEAIALGGRRGGGGDATDSKQWSSAHSLASSSGVDR